MRTRTRGNTGLEVSILGYGASPLGRVFGDIDETRRARCWLLQVPAQIAVESVGEGARVLR